MKFAIVSRCQYCARFLLVISKNDIYGYKLFIKKLRRQHCLRDFKVNSWTVSLLIVPQFQAGGLCCMNSRRARVSYAYVSAVTSISGCFSTVATKCCCYTDC